MTGDQHRRILDGRRQARLLRTRRRGGRARPPAAARAGTELGDRSNQIVGAVHRLDHDAELTQVVAPDVLDQLGVVPALDPDPARRAPPAVRASPAIEPELVSRGSVVLGGVEVV